LFARNRPHNCGTYGLVRAAKTRVSTALGCRSMVRMGPVVRATEDPPRSRPTSRHLTSSLTVQRELRRCRLAWRLSPTRSHGGSQGFKSPHLHPTTALVTGLADHLRRAGVLLEPLPGQQTGSNRERSGQPLPEARLQRVRLPVNRRQPLGEGQPYDPGRVCQEPELEYQARMKVLLQQGTFSQVIRVLRSTEHC
jgi:hypothetical protein